MKYHYFYQNSNNESLDDWIVAKDRNDAYKLLRERGIKPFKVIGRDPMGWKRWTAIAVLATAVVILLVVVVNYRIADNREAYASEERSQVYGDPFRIREFENDGWRLAMGSDGDAWFARHARPGVMCDCEERGRDFALDVNPLRIATADEPEVAKMKRLVNGMKLELAAYLAAGGSRMDYMVLCDERLRTECDILNTTKRELKALESRISRADMTAKEAWAKKNATLRSMGLPTVAMPD